jgi:hypothetical protein
VRWMTRIGFRSVAEPTLRGCVKWALVIWSCAAVALLALPTASAVANKRKHRSCPKGQVRTKQGCKTPLAKYLVTYRSANHRVAAQLGPNKYANSEVVWNASVAYPYQKPCGGPALTGALAAPIQAGRVLIKTKTPYVGTTFSGKQIVGSGVQQEAGGWRSVSATVSATGKVLSAKTLSGTVTITETRGFGPTPSSQTTYTTCGSTFAFTLHRYRGAFPGV